MRRENYFIAVIIGFIFLCFISCKKKGLLADTHEVSIHDFEEFILSTSYITTADTFGWSSVFNLEINQWDTAQHANWKRPFGREEVDGDFPVTQVSYYDACAYCKWRDGRLPTAEEWDALAGEEIIKGNTWEGPFPLHDSGDDGYLKKIAPIGQFQTNEKGLHDMFGNVWEWTSTPQGNGMMIIKGGSFLCDLNFCSGYIPSRYQTTAKDSGLNHLGFRCVYD